jgi:uncharacterized protein
MMVSYSLSVVSLFILFKEYGLEGTRLDRLIGQKNPINLKLIAAITVIDFGFNSGLNSIILYNLSFAFPSYVESFLNERTFTNIPEIIYTSISVIFLAPVLEELIFRGVILQKWATKWSVTKGALVSSMLFALVHFRFDILQLFLIGIIFSILYFKSRSLISPILCHLFYNAMSVTNRVITYFSETPIERSALITAQEYQNAVQPLLAQKIFLVAISAPFLIYFIYKNFPKDEAVIPYYANDEKDPEMAQV